MLIRFATVRVMGVLFLWRERFRGITVPLASSKCHADRFNWFFKFHVRSIIRHESQKGGDRQGEKKDKG